MDVVALVASKAAVAAQKAGAKSFGLGNAVRKAARQVASFPIKVPHHHQLSYHHHHTTITIMIRRGTTN